MSLRVVAKGEVGRSCVSRRGSVVQVDSRRDAGRGVHGGEDGGPWRAGA